MAETQFDRERMLLGDEAMQVLAASHVAVFGVGGVGSFAAEALARAGVGAITLIDHDTVSLTNLNRQLVALHSTIGMRKTDVMASRILDINPACRVTNLPVFYEPECREDFFSRGFDYIADCIDSTRSKLDLIETAIRRGVPIISSMGTGNRLDPSKFRITDLSKTGCAASTTTLCWQATSFPQSPADCPCRKTKRARRLAPFPGRRRVRA